MHVQRMKNLILMRLFFVASKTPELMPMMSITYIPN